MAALAASMTSWIPEDEILLRNAVEAEGTVRFSRKFSIRELRDRWYSLLYDPVISAEASARMAEFELSASLKFIRSGIGMHNAEDLPKRKVESVRRHHTLRKKTCIRPSNSPNVNLLGSLNRNDGIGDGVEGMRPSNALPERDTSFHTLGYSSPQPRTPLWKTIEDIPAPAMPINLSHEVEDKGQGSEETFILQDVMDEKKINLSAISEGYFADLSDSLLNLENEDELNPVDADGKVTTNKSTYVGNNQMLLSPNSAHQDHVLDAKEPGTCLAIPDGSSNAELKVVVDQSLSHNGNQQDTCSEVNVPSSAAIRYYQFHELLAGEMECVLNSQDPEIPCNNDFMSGKVVAPSALQACYKEASDLSSSFSIQKNNEQKLSLMRKEDNSAQCSTASWMEGSDLFPGSSHSHSLFSCGVKSKSLDFNCLAGVSGQANNAFEPSQDRATLACQKSGAHAELEQELFYGCNLANLPLHAKSNSIANPSTLDEEASIDLEESENGGDIPCFSDIESLILDMDLCPDDQDSCFSREVSMYQHEETNRTIIRLEQCARSAMQRAIAYQGALAIFYGRRLKYYIKGTEIILGRATDDIDVDIDLGREGCANKISRQQALIKMEHDGSFFLRNLGKSSIFLNGKEIAKGQAASLFFK